MEQVSWTFDKDLETGTVAVDGDDSGGGPDVGITIALGAPITAESTVDVSLTCGDGEATLVFGPDSGLDAPADHYRFASAPTFPSGVVVQPATSVVASSGTSKKTFNLTAGESLLLRVKSAKPFSMEFEMKR